MSFPFFIVGCVRSGTTVLRDELRKFPSLICPEETHFFRWGEPFRSQASRHLLLNSATLKKHREIDGISEEDFRRILARSKNRANFLQSYMTAFAKAKGLDSFRWFDKTPQNVYGLALLASDMPKARFVNPVRNPLNVVASLRVGKVVHIEDIHCACNYWIEAQSIVALLQSNLKGRLMSFKYEDLMVHSHETMVKLCTFLELPIPDDTAKYGHLKREKNQWKKVLSEKDVRIVTRRCGPLASQFGYDLAADTASLNSATS